MTITGNACCSGSRRRSSDLLHLGLRGDARRDVDGRLGVEPVVGETEAVNWEWATQSFIKVRTLEGTDAWVDVARIVAVVDKPSGGCSVKLSTGGQPLSIPSTESAYTILSRIKQKEPVK
jgi:hypothetical protein